jgi:pseudouridine kinase
VILCAGGAHLDRTSRVAGTVILGSSNPAGTTIRTGGVAANVARLLSRLGHTVVLASLVGSDPAGDRVVESLLADGVDVGLMARHATLPTAEYGAVVDGAGNLVVGVADMAVYEHVGRSWLESVLPQAASAAAVVVDANLPAPIVDAVAHAAPGPVLADPVSVAKSSRLAGALQDIDLLFPDRAEAGVLGRSPTESPAGLRRAAASLRDAGVGSVIVSLGGEGVFIDDGALRRFVPAIKPDRVVSVTGAGDALLAGYADGLLRGDPAPLVFGLAAASLVLESDDAVPPDLTREALQERAARS